MLFIRASICFEILIYISIFALLVSCKDEVDQTKITWWQIEPYTIFNKSASQYPIPFQGFFQAAILRLHKECPNTFSNSTWDFRRVVNPIDFERDAASSVSNGKVMAFLPFSASSTLASSIGFQDESTFFLPLIEVSTSIYFFEKRAASVGSDLMAVIVQGWPLLTLIILGAAYSGIIIWLLDRLWNPTNFPKPFLRGFWEGFWWAFVTMTTVGYGDTTPKSVQARIYGLVWIVVGITILSVFTATVTTVLTQESLVTSGIEGSKVAVLNGSEDFRRALEKGADPVLCNSFDEILEKMNNKEARGGLIDHFSFAAQQEKMNASTLLEQTLDNPVLHGVLFKGLSPSVRACLKTTVLVHKQEFVDEIDKWTKPLIIYKTNAADNAQNIFQPTTLMFMWYAALVWAAVFILFIIWEIKIWRPKHNRRQKIKNQKRLADEERDIGQIKNNQSKANAEELKRNVLNLGQEEKSGEKTFTNEIYCNQVFVVEDQATIDFQSLIKRQNKELLQLQKKLADIKLEWDKMVREVQKRHREEQKVYLASFTDDFIKHSVVNDNDKEVEGSAWPTICL
ncbi:DgyrCDS12770 [Dimorphilus gyrociliatus]|uniref:DgyrCDS12770 n=1 Tax=Dimorphilus gyrociliatus TaxID=2664684 RepID=A0A7I8W8P7_9ANNE|nr:DgyrCDS12770 [Dimorphilus gyrociliatus]